MCKHVASPSDMNELTAKAIDLLIELNGAMILNDPKAPPLACVWWFHKFEGFLETELEVLGYWCRTVTQLTEHSSKEELTEFNRWLHTAAETVARLTSLQEVTEFAHQSVSQLTRCFPQAQWTEFERWLPLAAETFAKLLERPKQTTLQEEKEQSQKKKQEEPSEARELEEFQRQLEQRGVNKSIIDLVIVFFGLYRVVKEKEGDTWRLCDSLLHLCELTERSLVEIAYKFVRFAVGTKTIQRWLNGDTQSGRQPTIGANDLLKDILALFCKVSQSCGDCGLVEVYYAFRFAIKTNPWYTPFPATLLDIFWQAIEAEETLKTDVLRCVLACLQEVRRQQEQRQQQSDNIYAQAILTFVEISENEEELSWFFEGLCGVPAGTGCLEGVSEGELQ
jgi:hypothetical protein